MCVWCDCERQRVLGSVAWCVLSVLLWIRCCTWNNLTSIRWEMFPEACAWACAPSTPAVLGHCKEGDTGPWATKEMCGFGLPKPKSPRSSELHGLGGSCVGAVAICSPVYNWCKSSIQTLFMYLSVTAHLSAEWEGGNCSYKGLLPEQMCWPGKNVVWSSWKGIKSLLDDDLISLTSERAQL